MFVGRLRFGRLFFGVTLLTYVGYLVCLSSFIIVTYPGKLDKQSGCPNESDLDIDNNTKEVGIYPVYNVTATKLLTQKMLPVGRKQSE